MIERLFLILVLGIYLLLAVAVVDGLSTLRENIDKNIMNEQAQEVSE